jgi:hypothetical protein
MSDSFCANVTFMWIECPNVTFAQSENRRPT